MGYLKGLDYLHICLSQNIQSWGDLWLRYIITGFIDDSLLGGKSVQEYTENINASIKLLTKVGFIINFEKSV
jgi:hypothetical protein